MSPILICRYAAELLCPCGTKVDLWDKNWLEANKFSAFLSMAKGSCEPPALLQLSYCGGNPDEKPILMVGKNSTFDSGGINLKRCGNMSLERADVASAAVTIAVFRAISQMQLPINLIAMIALYENMPSGMALKPGDVLMARNGKTILMEDVALSGRIVTADLLTYIEGFQPCLVMHMGTSDTTAAPVVGYPATGVWSTSDILWEELFRAGMLTGDRFWRFPIWKYFRTRIKDHGGTDTSNRGRGHGKPQMLAPFLLEFAPPCVDLVHFDVTDTGRAARGLIMPYLRKGLMTGRPTRPLIQFLYRVACPHDPFSVCC
uniref:Cytosol aminopeptidase n=1 Tax=Lygus hesperus TaxID=30085 RepID=A0A0A9YQT8_LYGHE